MEENNVKIKEALKKPSTAENLNHIGDLYLKNGDKKSAVDYYYKSVSKLHYAQRDKQIAIYKKILKTTPADIKALEGIIHIFSRMGLIAEELKYLMQLADAYQKTGDYQKAQSSFGRIKELDPQNRMASGFLENWKILKEEKDKDKSIPQKDIQVTIEENSHLYKQDIQPEYYKEEKEMPKEEDKDSVSEVRDRASIGLFSATLEESEDQILPETGSKLSGIVRRYYHWGIIVLGLVLIVVIALFAVKGKILKPSVVNLTDSEQKIDSGGEGLSKSVDNYEIIITTASAELMKSKDFERFINKGILNNSIFYEISVKAITGCLPDEFIASPHTAVAFIKDDGSQKKTETDKGVTALNKIIFRSNACNRESAAVFMRFFVYHTKGESFAGLYLEKLGKDTPILLRWKK